MIIGNKHCSSLVKNNKFSPSFFLNEGRATFDYLENAHKIVGHISDITNNVFRPGIFKRVFVASLEHGSPYITAQAMMSQDPLASSKILSNKLTENIDFMRLPLHSILVSCAGTVGNVRLIDNTIAGVVGSQDIIRVIPKENNFGFVYAYLSTSLVYQYLQSCIYGSVVPRIEPDVVANIPLVAVSEDIKNSSNELISDSIRLREESTEELTKARKLLKFKANLRDLQAEDYDYYGPSAPNRKVSCFKINKRKINSTTINAFNLSERIRKTKSLISCPTKPLKDILSNGETFSTGAFPRVDVGKDHGVMLINQKDIFDSIIKGKYISKRGVKLDNLVEYGEVIIAGVGTLGESETFCRALFANEDLVGQLVSGEFIRMKTNNEVPSGYLFAWLSTDYGFRFLRNIQAGTKLCRPIPRLVREIPVPILDKDIMSEIDSKVRDAYTKRHKANVYELKAISMVENEIEKWNKAN